MDLFPEIFHSFNRYKNDIVFGICSFRDKWKDDKELKYWKII